MHPFFVYGTLLPGQPNHYLWGNAIVKTETAVFPNGRLYDMGSYPMMIEKPGEQVRGRLVIVDPEKYTAVLNRLDMLEGYDPQQPAGSAYRRLPRNVELGNGRSVLAWAYLGQARYVQGLPKVPSGDWHGHTSATMQQIGQWWATIDTVAGLNQLENNES